MANITIVKLKVRRGSDKQRKEIVLDQGEVGYTLDSKRLFVGDGATYGGKVAGNVNVGPFNAATSLGPGPAESPYLQIGDIGYADSRLYILTGAGSSGRDYTNALSGWAYIGNVPDDKTIKFENNLLTIKKQSLNGQYLGSSFFGAGLLSSNTEAGSPASVALNTDYLFLCGAEGADQMISPEAGSITFRELAKMEPGVNKGLKGGTSFKATEGPGEVLSLNVNTDNFKFDNDGVLELHNVGSLTMPISSWAGPEQGVGAGGMLGGGLIVNTTTDKLEATLQSADTDLFSVTDGEISLKGSTDSVEMPYIASTKGLITDIQSSIFDVITATGLSGSGAGDGVPIGSILPHAQAFTTPPAGYLLCNGQALDAVATPDFIRLWNTIGTVYGGTGASKFNVPDLTGGDVLLYGAGAAITSSTAALYLSATNAAVSGPDTKPPYNTLSAFGVNFIIKYAEDPVLNIFNGSPNQVTNNFGGAYSQQICYGLDSSSTSVRLSSAGFITMSLGGTVRNAEAPETNNTFDRFAIPVYSY